MKTIRLCVVLGAAVFVLLAAAAPDALAIPAFARKYGTSCQTCHLAFPKLNSYGTAFRLLGYRLPSETEDQIKQEDTQLGSEGYKRVWPKAVWPASIPGTVPLAVDTLFESVTQKMHMEAEHEEEGEGHDDGHDGGDEGGTVIQERGTIKNDLRFPQEFNVLAAGSIGDSLSYFGKVGFSPGSGGHGGAEVGVDHAQVNFHLGPEFNLKVGRVTPEIAQAFGHGYLLTASMPASMFQFEPVEAHGGGGLAGHGGGSGIELPHSADGVEAYGILGHRFEYSAGLHNGMSGGSESFRDNNNGKDVFARFAYKAGGLPPDGSGFQESEKNWREKSVRAAFFAYRGDGSGILHDRGGSGHHAGERIEDEKFTRLGVDANVFLSDLNVIFGLVRGKDHINRWNPDHDSGHLEITRTGDFTFKAFFLEGDVVLYPWLHAGARYDWLDPASSSGVNTKLFTTNITALIRANVKSYFEYQKDLTEGADTYNLRWAVRLAL